MRAVRSGTADLGATAHRGGSSSAHGHRHTLPGQHEHDFEPERGLPEALPEDEHVIWQASPDWRTLAVQRFHVRKLLIYFGLLLTVKVVADVSGGQALGAALGAALPMLLLSALAVGLVSVMAWLTARTTVYTLTDKRVVMRIGVVLTLTLNLPLSRVAGAALNRHGKGGDGCNGDLALQLRGGDRVAFLHLWPHARRWRFTKPEPTLLCLPNAPVLARQLTDAWLAAQPNPDAVQVTEVQADIPARQQVQTPLQPQPHPLPESKPQGLVHPGLVAQ